MKIFLKKSVVILNIFIQKQVFILKFQFQDLEMIKTHIRHLHILGLSILMSKISIKMIIIRGEKSTRQFMNLILEKLNYYLKHLFSNVKSIQMIHKTFHLKSRIILKPSL